MVVENSELREMSSLNEMEDITEGATPSKVKKARLDNVLEFHKPSFQIPLPGTLVGKELKCAGFYILGPSFGFSPVKSLVQCVGRDKNTDKYYSLKILSLSENEVETQDIRQGKMLLHTEYSLLSLLSDQPNVIHHRGFFQDFAFEEKINANNQCIYTGRVKKRLCLVLDCLIAHEMDPRSAAYINMQQYVIREKKLNEREALVIFFNIVSVVKQLHNRNIVHRDLKLGNFVLNRQTMKITITNFCLGKQLSNENDRLIDQRGSPAYISPDVLCRKPYKGKPSDVWALGVALYTMLYGQFPFYDSSPNFLFEKIRIANYFFPSHTTVTAATRDLIRKMLVLDPDLRMTASEILEDLTMIVERMKPIHCEQLQVVPDIDDHECNKNFKDEAGNAHFKCELYKGLENANSGNKIATRYPVTKFTGQIPVSKYGSDARELTASEIVRYQTLLCEHSSEGLGYSGDIEGYYAQEQGPNNNVRFRIRYIHRRPDSIPRIATHVNGSA